jgi:hypothetical protein
MKHCRSNLKHGKKAIRHRIIRREVIDQPVMVIIMALCNLPSVLKKQKEKNSIMPYEIMKKCRMEKGIVPFRQKKTLGPNLVRLSYRK